MAAAGIKESDKAARQELIESFCEAHIKEMMHAIGLDRNKPYTRHGRKFYRPLRNRCYTFATYRVWRELEMADFAESEKAQKEGYKYYRLTRAGLDWIGEKLNIKIYDEED